MVGAMNKDIRIIGVPMDLGQSRRGVDLGPGAVRYAGLDDQLRRLGYRVHDFGNIETPVRDTLPAEGGLAYLPAVVAAGEAVYQVGRQAITEGCLPLFLGGDHSIAIGTIGGVSHDSPCGVLWIDAHGDFNTPESSPSGNLHGMPLAALMGLGAPELVNLGRPGPKLTAAQVTIIGARDLDPDERKLMKQSGIGVYTMRQIDDRGIAAIAREALARLSHLPRLHVSLDMDVLDPTAAPGVGTPVSGGLTYREAHLLMELIADSGRVGSADVVEINPILDHRNATGGMAVELVSSLLGRSIL
jgi:arginase